ncbi:penicillin-binding transpeptidase domain-containing protein [Butyrivibrio sp. MC2013]|uniref:penicillin-binding transpeptidase domain-containing protein n=1 Tax=Butyrivibrio sp. MC2013 TaxID=1280686 RepID=UPI000417ABE9|nr:penicillin-binding transpeptidase domain-containing protein [Butyrivibrio sp. MC2013]
MEKRKKVQKFTARMRRKLGVLFVILLMLFGGLGARLLSIILNNEEEYQKQVLAQRAYDSISIAYRRGSITDRNGTVLAVSEKVYNVILDVRVLTQTKEAIEPTIAALVHHFDLDPTFIRNYIKDNPTSAYCILARELSYDTVAPFMALMEIGGENYNELIKGVWFEDSYIRKYPNGSMASDLIGFTTGDGRGMGGLEQYYEEELRGTEGREYGYLDDNMDLERTTIPATDGNSIVTTIDGNLQTIVEKQLLQFNEQYRDAFHEGNGAENVGCIMMDVNNGEILAMASYPNFDLNDVYDTDALIGMRMVDEEGKKTDPDSELGAYINEASIENMSKKQLMANLNSLWKNFTIATSYEPGSVAKPFTVAAAIDGGAITGNESYECNGSLHVGDRDISCHNRYGDGTVSVARSIEISCNVALMKVGQAMGAEMFAHYQHAFGFGLKTNIDLYGETRTANLIYSADKLGPTELATGTFGQGFNVTMIETIAAFSSLINGGYYYQPHVVSKILSPGGATIKNIQPRVIRQTISESTSDKVREYCNQVVSGSEGTGKTARPAGYMIGGKTGTAETIPRDKTNYVVSFMGYAPADDPQIAIYVVVDRPNTQYQDDAKFATRIVRGILSEALPYLHFPMTEGLSETEEQELLDKKAEEERIAAERKAAKEEEEGNNSENGILDGNELLQNGEGGLDGSVEGMGSEAVVIDTDNASDQGADSDPREGEGEAPEPGQEIWRTFDVDPETGYYIDPNTGNLIDPETGNEIGGASSLPDTVAGEGNTDD